MQSMNHVVILAQGGSGLSSQVTFLPQPLYQVLLVLAALLFAVALVKGVVDMRRPRDPDAPKPGPAVWLSRLAPFFLALLNLVTIVTVLAGLVEVRQLTGLRWLAELLLVLQLAVVILVFRNPESKQVMRIIHPVLLVAGLIALPLFLLPNSMAS